MMYLICGGKRCGLEPSGAVAALVCGWFWLIACITHSLIVKRLACFWPAICRPGQWTNCQPWTACVFGVVIVIAYELSATFLEHRRMARADPFTRARQK